MVNFTNDDILLYLNNELSAEKATAFQNALLNDWSLREKYEILASSQKAATQCLLGPSKRVIDNIMNYARQTATEKAV